MKKSLLSGIAAVAFLAPTFAKAEPFSGAYAGLQLGYNNTDIGLEYDAFGFDMKGISATGFEGGIFAGYRLRQERFVYGLEAGFSLSNAKFSLGYDDGVDELGLRIKKQHDFSLGARAGYLLTENTLIYLGADYARGKFKDTIDINGDSES